jgi:aminopeptidase N
LNILPNFFDETSEVVWEAIASGLGSIRLVMNDNAVREGMKPFVRLLVSKEVDRLGIEAKKSDSHFDKLLRPLIIGLSAGADEPAVLKEIKELFYSKKPADIDPDIRGVVYITIARLGTKSDFELLLKMYKDSDSAEEKLKLTAALTNFKQPELINKALAMIRSDDVRSQDIVYWLSYGFSNHYGRDKAWQWLKDNWDWIEDSMGEDLSFYRMPFYVAVNFSSLEFLKEFKQFFKEHMSGGFERPVSQAIETIEWQAAWKKRDLEAIIKFFTKWAKT